MVRRGTEFKTSSVLLKKKTWKLNSKWVCAYTNSFMALCDLSQSFTWISSLDSN